MKTKLILASVLLAIFLPCAQSPAETKTNAIVGPLIFDKLDEDHLWIYVDRFRYPRTSRLSLSTGWMIYIDGIYNPYRYLGYVHDDSLLPLQADLNNAIYRCVSKHIAGSTSLWLMITNEHFAPVGEVGGLLFTDSEQDHTIQEYLITEGFARVDLGRINARIPSEYINDWKKLEEEARLAPRGFWKTHPEVMKRYWDEEIRKRRTGDATTP